MHWASPVFGLALSFFLYLALDWTESPGQPSWQRGRGTVHKCEKGRRCLLQAVYYFLINGEYQGVINLLFFRPSRWCVCRILFIYYVILKFTYPWTAFLVVTPTCRCHVAAACGGELGRFRPIKFPPIFAWHIWHSEFPTNFDCMTSRHNSTIC